MELFIISNQCSAMKEARSRYLFKALLQHGRDHRLSLSSEYNLKQFENSDSDEDLDEMTL